MHNFFGGNLPGMLLLAFSLNLDISCKTCYEKEFLVQVFYCHIIVLHFMS